MARITVDPVTRIEGHLRIDVEVENGRVTKSWSSAQMFRGIETILTGRDPRDAWVFTQRFCGVCTTVHALASVRTIEDAMNMPIPKNAQFIRNLVSAAHTIQDNIVHFYHLSALDWVDIVSALSADPAQASKIAQSYSNWYGNTTAEFKNTQERLKTFVDSGKLGIFGSGYWGHPAMKLPPEVNLIAFSHYLRALEYQRKASQFIAILGGKDPHIQNLCVGGVATAVNLNNEATLNMERIAFLQSLIKEVRDFCYNVYLPDVIAIGSFYPEWFTYGAGVTNYLSVPDFPIDEENKNFLDIGGIIHNGDLKSYREIKSWKEDFLRKGITESTLHAWYEQQSPLHPFKGESNPDRKAVWDDNGRYTWCKAPRFNNKPFQVGPLAQILAAYAGGHTPTVNIVNNSLNSLNTLVRSDSSYKGRLGITNMSSTMGRHLARAIRVCLHSDRAIENIDLLLDNLAKGDLSYATPLPAVYPSGHYEGAGFYEAARGMLSHWAVIDGGKLTNYQCVVPSTWNAGPKDESGAYGPYEASLIGNPVALADQPLEVIRTVHSFDPCIACAVHTIDPEGNPIVSVKVD